MSATHEEQPCVEIVYVCVDACRLRARRCIRAETFECSEFVDLEGATNDTEFVFFLRIACWTHTLRT